MRRGRGLGRGRLGRGWVFDGGVDGWVGGVGGGGVFICVLYQGC